MNNVSKELVQEKMRNLPRDLRDIIFSEDMVTKMKAVAKHYGISIEQLGGLDTATNDVILGIVHPKDYINELSKNLNIDTDVARSIAKEINEQIFAPLRESLKSVHDIKEAGTAPQPTPQPALAPKSPFEQKLEEKVFVPPLKTEVEQAQKENRYPDKADPYREPPK